ncbi:MAG: putative toxin-antitoxin system toxin component, PIN family [Rhizobiaceae bacterium]
MKIVVDTSVFVSATLSAGGASRQVIRLCLEGVVIPLMSGALFHEFEDVMGRAELFANCRIPVSERNELLDAFLSVCAWTPIWFLWRPNLRDEDDNFLVELAVSGVAAAIVTSNKKDFRGADLKFGGFAVLDPAEFLSWRKSK